MATGFPVVGLGASAGGLEALRLLFARVPSPSPMAFVVIQHLDPDRESLLASVLAGITALPVTEATDGMAVERSHVYVIPADSDLTIRGGVLELIPRRLTGRLHLPVDTFFQALAEDQQERAIGVVLSGSGSDGTEGLRAIKATGGLALAQDPRTSQFPSMPESAIAAGVVDFQGSAEAMAQELVRLASHPYVATPRPAPEEHDEEAGAEAEPPLAAILALLRERTGTDFSGYKRTTLMRRIERRMALRHLSALEAYANALQGDPSEAAGLAQDLLIHVTSFFRDPEAFQAVGEKVFRELARRKEQGGSIRIWVPGCSTGQEVYSLAISLLESLEPRGDALAIKLFGSDLSEAAIQTARIGVYPESAMEGVSPDRLSRFFERVDGGFRIGKRIRDLCVFVKHDLTVDPPFAKLDLISCRNLLIYFDAALQRRVIPMLHYCLNRQGFLFLGQSEAPTGFQDLFEPVDKEHRIFQKSGHSRRLVHFVPAGRATEPRQTEAPQIDRRHPSREAQRQADLLLLARYAPPGVLVNDRLEIIQFRGRTGTYLEAPPGQPQANVLRMARDGLAAHLHEALERARTTSAAARREGIRLRSGAVNVEVIPLPAIYDGAERYFLILFEEPGPSASGPRPREEPFEPASPLDVASEVHRLEAELLATRDYLQSLLSEHQSTTDELAATNEELVAANEELQSTNEELQSAKEELQSTNEELTTVNDQLRFRNQELDQVASDLANVLSSVEIPVIIVDLSLRIRRFTPTVGAIASLIPEDVGRSIDDLRLRIQVEDLGSRIKEVLVSDAVREWEVQGLDGRWFRMQIRPYRTVDHRLDGAVLSFVDVDVLKQARREAEGARDYALSIVETVPTGLVVLDEDLRVVSANEAFYEGFDLSPETTEGEHLFQVQGRRWDVTPLRGALEGAVSRQTRFTGLELHAEFPGVGRKVLSLTGRPVLWGGGAPMVLLSIVDVTGLRELEAEKARLLDSEQRARLEAERANQAKDQFLATLSHELRTPLSTMLMSSQLLQRAGSGDQRIERASAAIQRSVDAQARLIDDLLDVSRIAAGKLLLDLGSVDLEEVVHNAVDLAQPAARAKALELTLSVEGALEAIYGDAARLQQVVSNLLTNAIKFTPRGGRISVRLERQGSRARLSVTDTGMGIRPESLERLFARFVQADSSVTRTHGGLGLGLSIVRHLVEAQGGTVQAESPGEGKGATFIVTLPLGVAQPQAHPGVARPGEHAIKGVRVLIVEDDEDTREAYVAMLTELGAEVWGAPSAALGLDALKEFRPQVLLCDLAMPGADGLTFIRQVRRLGSDQGGDVPAAAVTALAGEEDRQRALQAGFQVHAPKPIDAVRLSALVRLLADWSPSGGAKVESV